VRNDATPASLAGLAWPELLVEVRGSTDLALWRAAAARLRRERDAAGQCARRQATLAVLASHTTSFYAELLPLAALSVGIDLAVHEMPFGQLEQQLIGPSAELRALAPDYVLLAGTAEDVVPSGSAGDAHAAVHEAVGRWSELAGRASAGLGARVIQQTFVPGDDEPLGNQAWLDDTSQESVVSRVNAGLAARANGDVLFVDCGRLAAKYGRGRWRDPRYWHAVRQPVALDAVPMLARATAGVLAADLGLARRCLITDLDNTLWDGEIGEAGPEGVGVDGPRGEAFVRFQEYLLGLRRLGMVLAVASKNDPRLIAEVFDKVPGMRLRYSDFSCVQAGWSPKSVQVRRISEQLRLGLDSMVLVDDNPAECAEVLAALPSVDVVTLPPGPAGYVGALADRPTLALSRATTDDAGRARSYAALAAAERERGSSSLADFLAGLRMRAEVRRLEPNALDRAAQLVTKTNQFNLTGRRYSRRELELLMRDPAWIIRTLSLSDRLADHGMTGLIMLRVDGATAEVDTLLLSCRVIGRTAERRLLAAGAGDAWRAGCRLLRGVYRPSARNKLVAGLYPEAGFDAAGGGEDAEAEAFEFRLKSARAAALLDTPYIEDAGTGAPGTEEL